MNEASGAAGGGNGVKLVVGALAIAGLAAGIYFAVGQPGAADTGARPEAAAEVWRARWSAAKLKPGRDVLPDGPDTAFAALQLKSLDAVRAKLEGLQKAGALVLADPRARRRHEVLTAGALLAASEGKAPPTVHPIEAAWLMLALARRVDVGCGIVEVQGAVPTPLMLTRQRYAIRCGEATLTLDGKPLVGATRPLEMAEAAATFLVVRGHVARARGVFDAAQADLVAADSIVPGLPAARFARGVLQVEQGVTEMGEIACTGAVEAADDPMARLFLADVYTATAKPFKAFEMVDAVSKRWPKLAEGHVAQGMLVAGRVETAPDAQKETLIAEARAAFSRALELDPAVGGAEAGLAQLDLIAGDREAAIAKLRAAVTRSKDLDAAALLAQILLNDQDAQGAVAALREVDRRDEERWWMLLVQALASTGDGDSALREAEAASAAFPASKQLVVLRAQLLRQLERVEEAANLMRPLAQDPGPGPEGASFAAMAAELLLQVGDLDGAIAGLRTSLARDPAQKEAAMLLIAALGRAGKVQERDLEIAKLIGSGTSHEEIATLMLEVGDAQTAESVLEAGVQAAKLEEPAGQRLVTLLAMLYVASGRKPEALTLKTSVVAKVGGAETPAGAALIKVIDDAIAGAEAELAKMAQEGEAPPAAEPAP